MLIIIVIALFFGLTYNYLYYPHSLTEFLEAGSISILIGITVGIVEEFALAKFFQKKSFLFTTFVRATLYSLFTSIVLCLVLSIEISFVEQITYPEAVTQYLRSPLFQRDFMFSFLFIILIIFSLRIILLIGRANFFRLITGLYHRPREVSRIFMFVDLKGSTSIAEKLSNTEFSALIKDCFYDISDAIIMFHGEVYQYVGDEVVVVWPVRGSNLNCIRSFYKMDQIIKSNKDVYQSRYGLVPVFKAGIHMGSAIMTSVGKQRRALVYHGDVLNTTSRIEGKCNELDQKLLISEDLLANIDLKDEFVIEEKGEIELRGKARKLRLYGVKPAGSNT